MEKADVVIIGGGMAGLSTALEILSQMPLKVVLLEREYVGFNHTTPAVLMDSLQQYGLEDTILQTYSGFRHDSPTGVSAAFDFGRVVYAGIDYKKACEILFERAVNSGVRLITANAIDWSPTPPNPMRPIVVRLDNEDLIQTEILVDASGHNQWAARHLAIRGSNYYSHCFGEYLSGCNIEDPSFFRFLRPTKRYGNGGGWFYPTGRGSASIGYSAVTRSSRPESGKLSEDYFKAKAEFLPYAYWVKDGKREHVESGTVPVGRIGRFFTDRIVIVGDAAGQAHPWVVEGCRPALDNGRLCAQAVVTAFEKECFDKTYLSLYEKWWQRINRERFWRAAAVADVQWNRSDEDCDRVLKQMKGLSPKKVMLSIRDNHASCFEKVYAIAGYLRRGCVKWLYGRRSSVNSLYEQNG